jgi:2-isopropylmalate synthase
LGFRLAAEDVDRLFFGPFKALADRKKEVFDEDLEALVESEVVTVPETWRLRGLQVATGTAGMPTATVELEEVATADAVRDAATGDGPVDAIFRAIERLTGVSLRLTDYQIRSVTGGKEAQGEVRLEARYKERTVSGRGVSTDVLEASARAFVNAINRAVSREAQAKTPAKKSKGRIRRKGKRRTAARRKRR